MSSHICDSTHIASLAHFYAKRVKPGSDAVEVANTLMEMNYKSVNERYGEDNMYNHKVFNRVVTEDVLQHPILDDNINLSAVVLSERSAAYQMLDTDDFEGSEAEQILKSIEDYCYKLDLDDKIDVDGDGTAWGEYEEQVYSNTLSIPETIKSRMLRNLSNAGIGTDSLDNIVYEGLTTMASAVNNDGLEAQLDAIVFAYGEEQAETIINNVCCPSLQMG